MCPPHRDWVAPDDDRQSPLGGHNVATFSGGDHCDGWDSTREAEFHRVS